MDEIQKIWRTPEGKVIPLEECTKEQLLARFRHVVATNQDRMAEKVAGHEALIKRLQDARKAKRLANARADRAEAAMRAMLDAFAKEKVE